ncbi:pirin family protein, partial [Klebsiella pneumoniae]|nr:pirin family protein [Klebsiella pneumoniae]
MQLWLDACPQRENPLQQKINVAAATLQLLASPEGGDNSLQLRQQAWVYHIAMEKGANVECKD